MELLTDTLFVYVLLIGSIIAIAAVWFKKRKSSAR
ncbi:EYxxD motif small membrane protein [Anaerobacillus sp. MEB173]